MRGRVRSKTSGSVRAQLKNQVQIHWVNSPSSFSNPSEQNQSSQDIEELVHDRSLDREIHVRMVDPESAVEADTKLQDDFLVTVIVLAVSDTKLDKHNAEIANSLLEQRRSVFLVLKGLQDGNITRFGFLPQHANDVMVYDLDIVPPPEPEQSIYDMLVNQIESRLTSIFDDYPVDNFRLLLQQRRDAEVKQEQRSWTLLLLSVVGAIILAVTFVVVAHFTALSKDIEIAELDTATALAKEQAKTVSSELAYLEEQYIELSDLKEQREFYSNSLTDDVATLIVGLGDLELARWDFDAEQTFMSSRVDELTATTTELCGLLGNGLNRGGGTSDSAGHWARFVSYCENLHVLSTCNATTQGNGVCEGRNNYRTCNWDGGDCCPGTHCLDGTHVCDNSTWHFLDDGSECVDQNCSHIFGYYTYTAWSDGVNRYTPSCTNNIEATELVFVAEVPPGGLIEMKVESADTETTIFIEAYLVPDVHQECPVENDGLSPGTGDSFVRCTAVDDRYILVQNPNNTWQHAFFIVDVEDVAPMELTIKWRNTASDTIHTDGGQFMLSQRCEIGHNVGLVGDGICHSEYDTASCNWDGGDCRCVFGLPSTESFGDGVCDILFLGTWTNTRSCGWDGGDCAVTNDIDTGSSVSNVDKPNFDNNEILDDYTVLPSSSTPETLTIERQNRTDEAPETEVITLVALPRCNEPSAWICPHEWYNGNNAVSFDAYYRLELAAVAHTSCPAPAEMLELIYAHFDGNTNEAICDCGCGAADPDCIVDGVEKDCGNYANIDPLTLRYDPAAPEEAVPDTCLCVADY